MLVWPPKVIRKLIASWRKIPISYRGIMVIALPTFCTLATLGSWIYLRDRAQTLNLRIDQGNLHVRASQDILTLLLNAETSVRGYALTQDKRFLEPYTVAQQNLTGTLNNLSQAEQSTLINTEIDAIKQRFPQRLQTLKHIIQEVQSASPRSAEINRLLEQGKLSMDDIRARIEILQRLQKQSLEKDLATVWQIRDLAKSIQQLMIVVSLLAFVAAVYLFQQLENELGDRERQLFQSKTLIKAITSNVVDGVLTLNQHGRIETINATVSKLFQYDAIDLLGQHINKLWFKPAKPPKVSPPFMEELLIGNSWQTIAYRQDESAFPVEISISETQLKKQFIVLVRDMTERVESETQLKAQADQLARLNMSLIQSNTDLERQNRELETITYVAAHDLKTPLRGIATLSEWIEDDLGDQLPPTTQEQLQLLRSRVHRLTTLINELLDYSRIGRNKNVIQQVVVKDLLQKVIHTLAPPQNIIITIGEGMPTFKTDQDLLQKVFYQLIENSILHHDLSKGIVTIAVEERPHEYEFIVTDDGPGIAPEYYQKVFTAFQVLDRREDIQQTGIGLAMVKKIVELTGGMVWLNGAHDRGLAVHFTWAKQNFP
jgi:PAS domain S-box-containing protein